MKIIVALVVVFSVAAASAKVTENATKYRTITQSDVGTVKVVPPKAVKSSK
ncbi:MAG: hypothetical protein ACJ76H_05895 [Bacteriovoracaceae bacterium]